MSSAALESTLELWSATLRQTKQRIRRLFAAPSIAASANAFLVGLLGGERRKTGLMRAEAAGDPSPRRQQAILGRTHWDAEALRDVVRDDVVETLASPDAVLVVDETGFLKQGKALCGTGRQYTGSAGRSPTARSGCWPSTSRIRATPSSIVAWTCPMPGPAVQPEGKRRMSRAGNDERPG
ncbi:transposase [Methylobacterium sp.]|uniref:transposase n=1 Tax=Methylobacterium sp. TaxID=409 RepID=UPI000C37F22A|nr:transposase [Methylobacterium sp.]MBP33011.1 hypothetical protein [Methylobacterium sp.]